MIGIIPSGNKTFIVEGYFNDVTVYEEGKLYIQPATDRVFIFSTTETRSNPKTGYFPIWNGKETFATKFSHEKYISDVKKTDIGMMCSNINSNVAEQVLYQQRRSDNDNILEPTLTDGDNMFTQCIKGVLNIKKYTMVDLVDMSIPQLTEKIISNYYSQLNKITFMRLDKWVIWIDYILHMRYTVTVYDGDRKLLTYDYPSDKFDTGIVKYDAITKTKDDPFKKIIKIITIMENINKNSLRSDQVDDYTINNMLTTINSNKLLSSQLFSRFIRMANLSYTVDIYDGDQLVFEYRE